MTRHGERHFLARRRVLGVMAAVACAPQACRPPSALASSDSQTGKAPGSFAAVAPDYIMRFPHDEGSHPEFRVEWWYVTGWLSGAAGRPLGFQITFFRTRTQRTDNPSAFAPHQILIAHAALSDPQRGRLQHDQRAARAAFGLAGAALGRTEVWIDDWALRQHDGYYAATIAAGTFRIDLRLTPTQPPLLHGAHGFSQKGPHRASASYYYSIPHLQATGTIAHDGQTQSVRGGAWLDHEWSSSYMDERAVGWDWIGINLDDGGALMAFQMRATGGEPFWASATYRNARGEAAVFPRDAVRFIPQRSWHSARTGANYPVAWTVQAGDREMEIAPLFDDQENDTRATTGAIYWEGAVRALASEKPVGRGYLELTGYWRPLKI
jgi:predicted secreted hydrolase